MKDFKTIQTILGQLPKTKKIYLLGSTGAGKTSLVQKIIGTSEYGFPTTTHRRTTIAPTEYVIKSDIPFKTTIILKTKEDIVTALEELIEEAIKKALTPGSSLEDIAFELEQSPDERFKLKHIIKDETITRKSQYIRDVIVPLMSNSDTNSELLFSDPKVIEEKNKLIQKLLKEIECNFYKITKNNYTLFSDEPFYIKNVDDKKTFIEKNKDLLKNEFGSISVLVEYVRIQGDLLADWIEDRFDFVLIDGEGIGHSFGEKRDTLSTRHYDYFNFCNNIILIENADDPFTSGGQGAIESIYLNGYENKFRLVFSKLDKLDITDTNAYFRRNLKNLKKALEDEKIIFSLANKDTYKLEKLNSKKTTKTVRKEIEKLLSNIKHSKKPDSIQLEYDFSSLFSSLDINIFIANFQELFDTEHWAVVKALSKRMLIQETEYRHLKPLSWILIFIMRDINIFLQREDQLLSEISDSQNEIKQKFSKKILQYISNNFIKENKHLWQQAYEKFGIGSHKKRKDFIYEQILKVFLPDKKNAASFKEFQHKIKTLLLESGAAELKSAQKTLITEVCMTKIHGQKNFQWSLGSDVHVLIGKNGCGKSTILQLIDACINKDQTILEHYGYPYIEIIVEKEYGNGDKQKIKLNNNNSSADINSILISTFDTRTNNKETNRSDLDSQLKKLIYKFGQYERNLTKTIDKINKKQTIRYNEIRESIEHSSSEELIEFRDLSVQIDKVKNEHYSPIFKIKEILDSYFIDTNKVIIIDDIETALLVNLKTGEETTRIETNKLSSGEKQLLIVFLTVILKEAKPFILLMDEPEISLHVAWQASFIENIRKINPNIQIIIATHNPLITLNRKQNELGVIKLDNDVVQTNNGTKYLDISSILLNYFELSSLIGTDMQEDIKKFTELKLNQSNISKTDKAELNRLSKILENSFSGDIIYNEKYFIFLKYLKEHKDIDFKEYQNLSSDEMQNFLQDFGEFFND